MSANVPEVYTKLLDLLDHQGFGFQPTDSGNEYAILQRFFTPEQAQYMLEMPVNCFFTDEEYAKKSGRPLREAHNILEDMSHRGNIYRRHIAGQAPTYRIQPVIAGIWEAHVDLMQDDMDHGNTDWIMSEAAHFAGTWARQFYNGHETPAFRSLPVNSDFVMDDMVLAGDDIFAHLRTKKRFAVVQCLCRTFTEATGGYADPFKETCLSFDEYAEYYLNIGIGRELTLEETEQLVQEAIDRGLCIHVSNSKAANIMCCCDGRSCALIAAKRAFPGPAAEKATNYDLVIDADKCNGCGICAEICPVQVCTIENGVSTTNRDVCFHCGQCVGRCPSGARILKLKPADQIKANANPTIFEAYEQMQNQRAANGEL